MIDLMDYHHPNRFNLVTIGGDEIIAGEIEVERIRRENIAAARAMNPAFEYIHKFELARDAWIPRKGKGGLSDEREMAWRRSRISRIMKFNGEEK